MATRVRVGEWSVEVDGERLTWTRGDEALVQSRTELRALGPPAAITLRASYRTGLEQLMRVVFAGTEAEHEAVGSVFPRLAQLTVPFHSHVAHDRSLAPRARDLRTCVHQRKTGRP